MSAARQNPRDFYQRLRSRIQAWAATSQGKGHPYIEFLLVAPDLFHLLLKLASDPEVPVSVKAKLTLAIFYFIHPADFIPEMVLGPAGFLDDVALSAYVLNAVFHDIPPEVIEKHWSGHRDVLLWIQRIIEGAGQMIGSKLLYKLKFIFKQTK